ncbi:tripartite tricarboxylate transporter substrate binding protein [Oceaniglobus ichthyenteri]|uniref:tripartite tricarboxylate transporter substrate binding protein n=1 Tax=Oceaniglobus ichthyenteri TaxID=2136177 RepID=UPI000D3C17C7|nr:tripartite tricarboxylate transporter substrate binding protein [Oceaniglobus ichthyenteri]
MNIFMKLATTSVVTALMGTAAIAQAAIPEMPTGYGKRPITVIVPYGAGGGSDQLTRAMVKAMEEETDLSFQIVNKPGGGGTAAIPDFMIAPADGYTILQHIDTAVVAFAKGDIRENPTEDWIPLCTTQITFSQIYIRPDETRYTDWDSFQTYVQDNPGEVTMGLLGIVGSMELVTMRQLSEALNLDLRQVTFDKPAETYGSLIGSQVDVLFEQPGDVRSFIDAGQMKPILTILDERPGVFADVPTHLEVGADFDALTRFRGFYVKKGTPQDRVDYLEAVCAASFDNEGYAKFNEAKFMNLINSYRDSEGTKALIDKSVESYKAIYKEIGLIE